MNVKIIFLSFVLALFIISTGCQYGYTGEEIEEGLASVPSELTGEVIAEPITPFTEPTETTMPVTEETPETVEEEPLAGLPTVTVREGEKVSFPALPQIDDDGDVITYSFTEPLNDKGEWLTKVGDEGTYTVTISASDGKVTTTQDVIILVEGLNKAPVIAPIDDITVNEADTVSIEPVVSDPDGDEVTVSYSGWLDEASYKTDYADAGTYYVTVSATDGKKTTTREVKVIVRNVNRMPVITSAEDVDVIEGDLVTVNVFANDLDGDALTYTYEEPLDKNGVWQTKIGDEGTYNVDVVVSDGIDTVSRVITVKVSSLNRAPVFEKLDDVLVTVYKGKTATVEIEPVVSDPDGDEITVSYSGWMTESTKVVSYDDGGTYTVHVTASDGLLETTEDFSLIVNRAPIIII